MGYIPTLEDIMGALNQNINCRVCNIKAGPGEYVLSRIDDDPFSPVCNECSNKRKRLDENIFLAKVVICVAIFIIILAMV